MTAAMINEMISAREKKKRKKIIFYLNVQSQYSAHFFFNIVYSSHVLEPTDAF